MTKIAINGRNLHELKMRQREYAKGTISYLSYPKHRIKTQIKKHRILVNLPPLLALELYRSAIIPQNPEQTFRVKLDGKDIGLFRVIDLRYPLSSHPDEPVSITLTGRNDVKTPDGV